MRQLSVFLLGFAPAMAVQLWPCPLRAAAPTLVGAISCPVLFAPSATPRSDLLLERALVWRRPFCPLRFV